MLASLNSNTYSWACGPASNGAGNLQFTVTRRGISRTLLFDSVPLRRAAGTSFFSATVVLDKHDVPKQENTLFKMLNKDLYAYLRITPVILNEPGSPEVTQPNSIQLEIGPFGPASETTWSDELLRGWETTKLDYEAAV